MDIKSVLRDIEESVKKRKGADNKRIKPHRDKIFEKFKKAGLDGNGRFEKAQLGYAKASKILGKFGIEPGEVVSAGRFRADSGHTAIELAWSNKNDPFSPEQIEDFMLAISWTKLGKYKYEVIAYLS